MSKQLPGIQDGERNAEEIDVARFVKLMEAGYDDFAVSTEHGSFQWTPPPKRPNSMAYFEFALAASIVAVILLIGVLMLVHEGKFLTAKEASAANCARLPLHF
jgi:hypothetical protein